MSEEAPWWYHRCTHNMAGHWGKWCVLREAEAVVVIYRPDMVHITVDLDGVGSSCKQLTPEQYELMSEQELLAYIQDQRRELRSLRIGP